MSQNWSVVNTKMKDEANLRFKPVSWFQFKHDLSKAYCTLEPLVYVYWIFVDKPRQEINTPTVPIQLLHFLAAQESEVRKSSGRAGRREIMLKHVAGAFLGNMALRHVITLTIKRHQALVQVLTSQILTSTLQNWSPNLNVQVSFHRRKGVS